MVRQVLLAVAVGWTCLARQAVAWQDSANPPLFRSELITTATAGHAIDIDVDIRGLERLYLVIEDGGNGFSHDWASWVNPRLIGPPGELRLDTLKPLVATADWGSVHLGKNCAGQPLRIAGQPFEHGIGAHANSVVGFQLPAGYERFKVRAGLDNGGTDQAGQQASVRFSLLAQPPKAAAAGGGGHDPDAALAGLDLGPGLTATLFAAEPDILSLTNLDVDHRGRVWVCEVVNYRGRNGQRPEGDRILICSDTNGDGVCDETKTYYQGRDIDSAMGICVLGNRVIVSASPNIWVFTDVDGDDHPDRKELLFSGTGAAQHDHSAHAFVFGPDGKLYWNFGNEGHAVHSPTGQLLNDRFGRPIEDQGKPYWGGMVFRCNLDGSQLEVLAHNFRNNYEVAVDAFGSLWQSDNDDDGNRGVRINQVMEYGNYGYLDELTGAGWQTPRTGWESEIPQRHWHQADPGVVPNLLVTGAGSPTGIVVYEGDLLPERFHNQVVHCDAGPNIVRAYAVQAHGAGFRVSETLPMLVGTRDPWFRPADVAVAPDGSLLVADWYDPGVGGHAMGDIDRGRLFRLAPADQSYRIPNWDWTDAPAAAEALCNPCQAVRFQAWQALDGLGPAGVAAVRTLASHSNPRYRARGLWRLAACKGLAAEAVELAQRDTDPLLRATAIRIARQHPTSLPDCLATAVQDTSPWVRREAALALREYQGPDWTQRWLQLARQYDGQDRWYLEALGIAAEGRWDEALAAWLEGVGEPTWAQGPSLEIIWRSRGRQTADLLSHLIPRPELEPSTALRLLRGLDFQSPASREAATNTALAQAEAVLAGGQRLPGSTLLELGARHPVWADRDWPHLRAAIIHQLREITADNEFVNWTARFGWPELNPRLVAVLQSTSDRNLGGTAARTLLNAEGSDLLRQAWNGADEAHQVAIVHGVQAAGLPAAVGLLTEMWNDSRSSTLVRSETTKALAAWPEGQQFLLEQAASGTLPEDLRYPAANVLLTSNDPQIREQAGQYLSMPASAGERPLAPLAELLGRNGDAVAGATVFSGIGTCGKCHRVREVGTEVGPDLSQVGGKLSREALFESILNPSAGISHNFEMYKAQLADGRTLHGVLLSRTPQQIILKDKEAVVHTLAAADVEELLQQKKSLMPDDLQKLLTEQQLIDVVAYLQTLK